MIQTLLFAPRTNALHYQTLIVAIIPLSDILSGRDLSSNIRVNFAAAAAKKKAVSLLGSLPWADPYACNPGCVEQLAGADELDPCGRDLGYAGGREFEVGPPCVAPVFGPFGLAWNRTCCLEVSFDMLKGNVS